MHSTHLLAKSQTKTHLLGVNAQSTNHHLQVNTMIDTSGSMKALQSTRSVKVNLILP